MSRFRARAWLIVAAQLSFFQTEGLVNIHYNSLHRTMGDVLEKSLDEIIGDDKPARREKKLARKLVRAESSDNGKLRSRRRGRGGRERGGRGDGLPRDIQVISHGRQVLRVRNIHPDLNGEDLNNLFGTVQPVDFVKFDNVDDTVAYVCFQDNNARANGEAVARYDGRKAMGRVLTVEVALSLADRLGGGRRGRAEPKPKQEAKPKPRQERPKKERKPKPEKKTAEDLDKELDSYMNEGQMNVD